MKVYAFYLRPDKSFYREMNFPIPNGFKPHAITDDKKLAKLFMKTRNMKKYIYKEMTSDMNREDCIRSFKGARIIIASFESYVNKNKDNQSIQYVDVVATVNEVEFVSEHCEEPTTIHKFVRGFIPVDIFAPKVKKALQYLYYEKIALASLIEKYEEIGQMESLPEVDYFDYGITLDQFAVFMALYKEQLSDDFLLYVNIHGRK